MLKKSVKLDCAEVNGTGDKLAYHPSVPLNRTVLAALLLYYSLLNSLHVHVSSSERFAQNIIQLVSAVFPSLHFQGAVHQYWWSIRDDAVRRKKGKYKEHRIRTRRRVRMQRVGHSHTCTCQKSNNSTSGYIV